MYIPVSNRCGSVDTPTHTTAEQTFLFNLWTACERIQDSIYDQSSPQYQLLEILNPLIFDAWVKSGRIKNTSSFSDGGL
mgnify:CR=1 FL=1|jgi:hypothetical protein